VALLADAAQHVHARIESGPANLKLMEDDALRQHFALLAKNLPIPAALGIGLAGLRTPADRARVLSAAAQVWPNIPCGAHSDLETALAAADLNGPKVKRTRVLILSGTGSCCYGQSPDGRTAKLGGWGHLLGDKASGYDIALRALKAVAYYSDRDGAWPKLGTRLLQALQLNEPEDLIAWVQKAQKREIAALAPDVFAAWKHRDGIATDIIQSAAHSLAKDGVACARRLSSLKSRVQFVFAGNVLLQQPRFSSLVTEHILRLWPKAQAGPLPVESVWGAVRLAEQEWLKRTSSPANRRAERANRKQSRLHATPVAGAFWIPESKELSPTERRNPRSRRLHKLPLIQAVALMLSEEAKVPQVLLKHRQTIALAVTKVVRAFRSGGRLFYVGAGTSGRLGVLDASECPPTFRSQPEQVQGIMAGGFQALWQSIEGAEDDAAAGAASIRTRKVRHRDIVIGIAASGRTPFVWGALQEAKAGGARTMLICFNPFLSIPRSQAPNVLLAVDLGPEVLTGSTRLKAGTATKLVLNMITTLAMVQMGKVVSNLMIDMNPSNQKLRQRAVRIVRELTQASEADAAKALERTGWEIKRALQRLSRSHQG
jgi:N-acetylmuramic acid 6-phosphate etherase